MTSTMGPHLWWMWLEYKAALMYSPLLTKVATGCVMTAISDSIAQAFTAALDGVSLVFDFTKSFRLVLFAMTINSPAVHYWNRGVEVVFFGWDPTEAVICKVLLDQTIFTLFLLAWTIVALTWAEQRPMAAVPARMRAQLGTLYRANLKVWGPTMILVYAFVEEDLRPLVLNIVSIGWQVFYLMLLRAPDGNATTKEKDLEEGSAVTPENAGILKGPDRVDEVMLPRPAVKLNQSEGDREQIDLTRRG